MEKVSLYRKERETLDFIKTYMFEHQVAPSLREIRSHFGQKSLSTIHKSLLQLEAKGFIERNKHQNRSITLTNQALEYFGIKPVNALSLVGVIKPGTNEIQYFDNTAEYIEVPETVNVSGRYVLQVFGDNLFEALLGEGDYVIIEKTNEIFMNQFTIMTLNGGLLLRRLIKRSNGQIVLRSENPDYDDILVQEDDKLYIIGKIIQVIRNYNGGI